jgi:hypothetical protein
MGIQGKVYVALEPEDGEQLEAAYSKQGQFKDVTLNGVMLRSCTLNGVEFRWLNP